MSIRHNGKVIAGATQYHPDLFDWKWADHQLDDVQWLRADTFSWQSGAVYQAAYQHLADDITGKTLQSETISGITIQFYLADDGHKICPATEQDNVLSLYNATGVAWYYIIDTANKKFKLPRLNPAKEVLVTGNAPVVGNGMTLGLTDGTDYAGLQKGTDTWQGQTFGYTVYGKPVGTGGNSWNHANTRSWGVTSEAEKSGLVAKLSDTTGVYKGKKYLYFYVGAFTHTAIENTAGLNAELFNGKADLNLLNTTDNVDFVIERQDPTSENNYTWYRKYKSGWVEQGGKLGSAGSYAWRNITLAVPMADTNYTAVISGAWQDNSGNGSIIGNSKTTTGFNTYATNVDANGAYFVSGKAA